MRGAHGGVVPPERFVVRTGKRWLLPNWGDPNGPAVQAIDRLEAGGVRTGYAEYWVAYDIDFLSKERLAITTVQGADTNRSRALTGPSRNLGSRRGCSCRRTGSRRASCSSPARTPSRASIDVRDGVHRQLHALGVSYRVVDAGLLRAVIPSRLVTPKQVGLP